LSNAIHAIPNKILWDIIIFFLNPLLFSTHSLLSPFPKQCSLLKLFVKATVYWGLKNVGGGEGRERNIGQ